MIPKVVGTKVLVKPITLEEHDPVIAAAKKSGIAFMDTTDRQEATLITRGVVMQIGATAFTDLGGTHQVQVGDEIDYVRHGGVFVHDPHNKEQKWYVIQDLDVLVVWKQE